MWRAVFLASLVSAADVEVTVDCSGSEDYTINGSPDSEVNVTAGDVINFNIGSGCGSHPFQIRVRGSAVPYTLGVSPSGAQTTGTVSVTTTTDTLATLDYQSTSDASMNGPINVAGGTFISSVPTGVTVSNANYTDVDLSWTAGVTSNCNFSHWAVVATPGGSAPAGCLAAALTAKGTTSCHPTGLLPGTLYSFAVQEVCFTPFASSAVSAAGMGTTLILPATAPTGPAGSTNASTTAVLSWTAGTPNGCVFAAWLVKFTSGATGNVTGCNGIANRSVTTCTATGLSPDTNYRFSVTETCTIDDGNSPESAASAEFTTGIVAPSTVTVSNPRLDMLDIAWTAGGEQCDTFGSWEVQTLAGDAVPGCTGIAPRTTMSCSATGLNPGTNYTFKVREVCSDGIESAFTTSNTLSTTAVFTVQVNCTSSNTTFLANGSPNPSVVITAGDVVMFWINGCALRPFMIQRLGLAPTGTLLGQISIGNGATGSISSGITNGSMTLMSSSSTPMYLTYGNASAIHADLIVNGGTVTKASVPTTVTDSSTTEASTRISWIAGIDQGDCVFSSWNVTSTPATAGCSSTNFSAPVCTVDGLTKSTLYDFTVVEVCANPAASSAASASHSVSTTAGTTKICRLGGTCNCGNVTTCNCQNTEVCNCENAETCTCQLGECNGGYSKMFVCQSSSCNVQCAEQCIGTCSSSFDIGRRLLGKAGCVAAGAGVNSPALLLVAGMFLLALK